MKCNFKYKYKHLNKENKKYCWLTRNEGRLSMECSGEENCIFQKK